MLNYTACPLMEFTSDNFTKKVLILYKSSAYRKIENTILSPLTLKNF